MKWLRFGLVLAVCLGPIAHQRADQPPTLPAPASQTPDQRPASTPAALPPIEVHFSPKGGCTEAVVKEINAAKTSILVQVYSFTSTPIAKALVDAHQRGVKVQVILDKMNRTKNYSAADFVQHAGIPTLIDSKHTIAHNKIMVLDGAVVITGSFNFTRAAEDNNAENLLVIRDKAIAEQYAANWKEHAQHSDKYEGKDAAASEPSGPIKAAAIDPPADDSSGGYVASKNSGVFHKADCGEVHRIHEKNLIYFKTRDEAIASGRRPCAVCKHEPTLAPSSPSVAENPLAAPPTASGQYGPGQHGRPRESGCKMMNQQSSIRVLAAAAFVAVGSFGHARTWTDSMGQFLVDGEFVSSKDGEVTINDKNGKAIAIRLDKLSTDDQKFIEGLLNPATTAKPSVAVPKDSAAPMPSADPTLETSQFLDNLRKQLVKGNDEIKAEDTDVRRKAASEKMAKQVADEVGGKLLTFRFPIKDVAPFTARKSPAGTGARFSLDWPEGIDMDQQFRPIRSFDAPLGRSEALRVAPGDILVLSGKARLVTSTGGRHPKASTAAKELSVIVVSGYSIALRDHSFKVEHHAAAIENAPADKSAPTSKVEQPATGK